MAAAMQGISYAMVTNVSERAPGRPKGFIPDEALDRDRRSFRTPRSRMPGRQVDPRDLDDGLPGGFLAGAIVEVWLALHLNWA